MRDTIHEEVCRALDVAWSQDPIAIEGARRRRLAIEWAELRLEWVGFQQTSHDMECDRQADLWASSADEMEAAAMKRLSSRFESGDIPAFTEIEVGDCA